MADDILLMFDFGDFQECEAQNEASRATLCMRRGGAEVGTTAVHNLGGPLGTSCVGVGNANMPSVECREPLPRKSTYVDFCHLLSLFFL